MTKKIKIGFHLYDPDDLEDRILAILDGDADDPDLWDDLYAHYMNEMPYGTAKARDGDPDEWMMERLLQEYQPR